ncbi:fimbrillin family protein [Bacteroides sp. OttesenSCG-928-M17]|nr:fimbrillin family protein [Bacteroides sp. OttesenSCG-928-M17]
MKRQRNIQKHKLKPFNLTKTVSMGLAALSLLLMPTSCESGEIETNNQRNETIEFGVVVGKQTVSRAAEFTGSSWKNNDSFLVKAYATGSTSTTSVEDFTLSYNGSSWSSSPDMKQPGYSLTYYTWFPTAGPTFGAGSNGNGASMTYTIPSPQVDLIAATAITNEATVPLAFNHILSQVNFALQEVPNIQIELTNIKVNGVYKAGTYTFGTDGGSWSSQSTTDNYTYIPYSDETANPKIYTNITNGVGDDISYMGNGGTVFTRTNALMLMPQSFSEATHGHLSFDFKLTAMDGTTVLADVKGTTFNFCDFETTTWSIGKRYLYLIDFTEYLTKGEISFTVTVNGWEDAENNTANTIEVASATKASIEAAFLRHQAANINNSDISVFPIALPTGSTLSANISVHCPTTGFDVGDEIKIHCGNADNAGKIGITTSAGVYWNRNISGSVITFKRNNTVNPVSQISIEAAIKYHKISNGKDWTHNQYEINFAAGTNLTSDITVTCPDEGFDICDVIKIDCLNSTNAAKVLLNTASSTYWTASTTDNVVTFTRNTIINVADKASIEAAILVYQEAKIKDGTLTEFPIVFPAGTTLSGNIYVHCPNVATGFKNGDAIEIDCLNVENAKKIRLTSNAATYWTRDEEANKDIDSYVTFTRNSTTP